MKNKMMKAMICALGLSALTISAMPATVSADRQFDFLVSNAENLCLWDNPDANSEVTSFYDGQGVILIAEGYENGYAYCYVPQREEYGWVDIKDVYLDFYEHRPGR